MKPGFTDCVEISPGVWCAPEEAEKLKAAQPTLADTNKGRRMTVGDIPDLGSPFAFLVFFVILVAIANVLGR